MAQEHYKPSSNISILEYPENSTLDIKGKNDTSITYNVQGDGYFTGDLGVAGKLTVDGLIDPTGLVLDAQSSTPFSAVPGKGTIWLNSDGYIVFSDQNELEHIFEGKFPEQATYWVDGYNGDDTNLGNIEANALLTIDEALKRAESSTIDVEIIIKKGPDPNGYTSERLFKPRIRKNDRLTIKGEDWEDIDPGPYTVTGFNFGTGIPLAYNFGNQGWTQDEFAGYYLYVLSSTSVPVGRTALIVSNDEGSLYLASDPLYINSGGTVYPNTNDTFKIVKPSTKININPTSKVATVRDGGGLTIYSGAQVDGEQFSLSKIESCGRNGLMRLCQIEFALDPSNTDKEPRLRLSGSFFLGAVTITKSSSKSLTLECTGFVNTGWADESDPDVEYWGAGVSLYDRNNALQPRFTLGNAFGIGSFASGAVQLTRSQFSAQGSLRIDGYGIGTTDFAPVCMDIGENSIWRHGRVSTTGTWIVSDSTDPMVKVRNHSTFWHYSRLYLGVPVGGIFARSEYHGHLHIGHNNPVIIGPGSADVEIQYASSCRLLNKDFSTLGDFTLGTLIGTSTVFRAAGAWESKEFLTDGSQGNTAYRT